MKKYSNLPHQFVHRRVCVYVSVLNKFIFMLLLLDCMELLSKFYFRSSIHQWHGRPGFNPRSIHTKVTKMVLDAALVNTQHYKVRIKGKVEQSKAKNSALPYALV